MSHGIRAYQQARTQSYGRVPAQQPAKPAGQPQAAEQPEAARRQSPANEANGLNRDEQQMIQRYFPEKPELSMRLYGPNQDARTVQPGSVGGRLDVSG